jgi:hypothetical protein
MLAIRIFVILASAALSGCVCCGSFTGTDVSITDREAFVPSGRLSIDIGRGRVDAPAVPHTGHSLELGLSGTSGEDVQNVSAGEPPVRVANRSFTGPAELHHEYDWTFAEVAYRYRKFFGSGAFGIEALGGIARAQLDLTTSSATQRASDKIDNYGPVGGFGIVWKIRPTTSLQSRFSLFVATGDEADFEVERLDLYVAQSLGRNVALRAGWSSWRVEIDRFFSFGLDSGIRASFSGFALGLDVGF